MNILIINCHTNNRGDEAAVRALVDELRENLEEVHICLAIRGKTVYPNLPEDVQTVPQFVPTTFVKYILSYIAVQSSAYLLLPNGAREFLQAVQSADFILHAPGGPTLGDTYYPSELGYLRTFDLIKKMNKPYMFYAPSMGPFRKSERNPHRKRVLLNAEQIILRDPISLQYLRELLPEVEVQQTLDSALQHEINMAENKNKLNAYQELCDFLGRYERCIGITITDLKWHPIHSENQQVQARISATFLKIIRRLTDQGYGIVFIPQLYGGAHDAELMRNYCVSEACIVMVDDDERYDSYFQQYVISQMFAVIGMRYHSNIFSAKMGTPFISVSYEQKMSGFMEKMGLQEYLINLEDLSEEILWDKFERLEQNYGDYKSKLIALHEPMRKESYRSTEAVFEQMKRLKIM